MGSGITLKGGVVPNERDKEVVVERRRNEVKPRGVILARDAFRRY